MLTITSRAFVFGNYLHVYLTPVRRQIGQIVTMSHLNCCPLRDRVVSMTPL